MHIHALDIVHSYICPILSFKWNNNSLENEKSTENTENIINIIIDQMLKNKYISQRQQRWNRLKDGER